MGIVGDMIGFRREDPMTPIEGTDLFYYSTRLEPDAAVAYGFIPDYGDTVADPLNQEAAESLFGEVSWLAMPAWDRPVWSDTEESESADAGRMEALEWTSEVREGQERKAQVYLPAGYAASGERRYPVLYVHAGQDALEKCHLSRALDRILGSSVEPLIAVFVETDPENRRDMGEGYGEMLVQELIPMVDAKYRTRTGPMDRGTVGFNNAGTPALTLAMAHPEVFGKVAVEAPTLMTAERVAGSLGDPAAATTVIYHAWGRYHLRSPHEAWDMVHANRDLWELLQESGYHPVGGEHRDGFAWRACEARADDWLEALFPVSTGS